MKSQTRRATGSRRVPGPCPAASGEGQRPAVLARREVVRDVDLGVQAPVPGTVAADAGKSSGTIGSGSGPLREATG